MIYLIRKVSKLILPPPAKAAPLLTKEGIKGRLMMA
jgi:hypothetical protein